MMYSQIYHLIFFLASNYFLFGNIYVRPQQILKSFINNDYQMLSLNWNFGSRVNSSNKLNDLFKNMTLEVQKAFSNENNLNLNSRKQILDHIYGLKNLISAFDTDKLPDFYFCGFNQVENFILNAFEFKKSEIELFFVIESFLNLLDQVELLHSLNL